ncbi:hypothetical protein ACH47X_09810 [Promicromonospora kroppenstedtii]|uniref:Carboxypeptidase regulatory-like domain-containing protein n=1 Tax=Promicromonospora kroppenstedtii TaxID=440482 RepID=A0ABW7XI50_9MICO
MAPNSVGSSAAATSYDLVLAPNAGPAGAPVQVQGYVGDEGMFNPQVGVTVTIYVDPAGTLARRAVATAVTDDEGWFATTLQPRTSGTYEVLVVGGGEVRGVNTREFTVRPTSQTIRSAVTSASKNGYTAKMRVVTQDVVTGVEPQTVYLDFGIMVPGTHHNLYDIPYLNNRRAEGRYGVGEFHAGGTAKWSTAYNGVRTLRMSAVHPAGLYDVYYDGWIGVYQDQWDSDGDGVRATQEIIRMSRKPITTIRVRRASTTTVAASSTSFTGSRNIELRGSVRKVQLINFREAANRLAPNTAVKLYFDPAGSAGPVYNKTVHTNSKGAYRTTVRTSRSGTWIAKYEGTSLQAPSKRSVTITVR